MNQKPKYTKPTTNSNIAANDYGGSVQFLNIHELMQQDNNEGERYIMPLKK